MSNRDKQLAKNHPQGQIQTQTKVVAASFEGPIPPPNILEGYKQIDPTFPERIMRMAEEQASHRRELEKQAIGAQLHQSARGQTYGLIIGALAIIGAVILGCYGQPWVATVLGGGSLAALVSAFLLGRQRQQKNLDDKK